MNLKVALTIQKELQKILETKIITPTKYSN